MLLGITSCVKPNTNENYLNFSEFEDLINNFTIDVANGEVKDDFSLPTSFASNNHKILIEWEIIEGVLSAKIVGNNKVEVYRPEDYEENIEVTLKAIFTYLHYEDTKTFNFTILKYDEGEAGGDYLNKTQFLNLVDDFTFDEKDNDVTTNFFLPEFIKENEDIIEISWEIETGEFAAELINNNEVKIVRPSFEVGNILVTLKATFTYRQFKETLYFDFTVLSYEDETPVPDNDNYVVYINLDGFAKYYYDEAVRRGIIDNLVTYENEGIFYENLNNTFPSITNPMQAMIISGATSSVIENVYRYYDKINDVVIQQARENKADTIYHSAIRNNIQTATVRHFPAEGILSVSDLNKLYVNTPQGEVSNMSQRFNQAIKLVKGESFMNGTTLQTVSEVPRLLTIYADELDGFGHNDAVHYDMTRLAKTESERINNVMSALAEFDILLKQLVDAYKIRGLYDKTTFFITTDHGMTPFGSETDSFTDYLSSPYSKTKWPALRDKLKNINSEYIFEYVKAGQKPKNNTTVVGVSSGLQMLLTFKEHRLSTDDLNTIKQQILEEEYVYQVYTRKELQDMGVWRGANIDLLVIPKDRYHFHGVDNPNNFYRVRGQHDTLLPTSNHIYGMIFGGNIKQSVVEETTSVLSFGTTMADVLGITLRDANMPALYIERKEN